MRNWFQRLDERDRARDVTRHEAPPPQHRVGAGDARGAPAGHDDRERRRDLGDRDRLPEAQPRQHDHPGRREGEQVERGAASSSAIHSHESSCTTRPDVAVVRDRRQDEDERRDDDAEAQRSEPESLQRASAWPAHDDRGDGAMRLTLSGLSGSDGLGRAHRRRRCALETLAPGHEHLVHAGRADDRPVRQRQRAGWRMNGRVCGPPRPPWNEISSSNAQPSSSCGS